MAEQFVNVCHRAIGHVRNAEGFFFERAVAVRNREAAFAKLLEQVGHADAPRIFHDGQRIR